MERWNGFEIIEMEFEGRPASLVLADESVRTDRWLFKMEYRDAFPQIEIDMLRKGWNVAFVKNRHRWCDIEDLKLKKRYSEYLIGQYGLSSRFALVGMSCGGLFSFMFASLYPKCVSGMYLDAPVMNLLSCPAGFGDSKCGMWDEFHEATGITKSELICSRGYPLDRIPLVASYKIPLVMIYGDSDDIVPWHENGIFADQYWRAHDLKILTIEKKGCGHHPHGVDDTSAVTEFIEKNFI